MKSAYKDRIILVFSANNEVATAYWSDYNEEFLSNIGSQELSFIPVAWADIVYPREEFLNATCNKS